MSAARPAEGQGPARLDVEGVVVAYGGLRAVDGVELSAEPGAIMGLIGPNGSGKTTLLDVVSGLVRPTRVRCGSTARAWSSTCPRNGASLGIVRSFQDCRLFPQLTVEEVLLLTQDATPAGGGARLDAADAMGSAAPSGQSARRSTRRCARSASSGSGATGRQLSTGTRRVVDLASIVLARPRLLLLDEPTAGIAQREAEAFVPLLRRLHEVADTTIVLVEHDVPLVFALVRQGGDDGDRTRWSPTGTPDQVRRDPRALAAYLGASEEALAVSGASRPGRPSRRTRRPPVGHRGRAPAAGARRWQSAQAGGMAGP